MPITSTDQLIAALAAGFNAPFSFNTNGATGGPDLLALTSGWVAGSPAGVTAPAVATLCTGATQGALALPPLAAGKQFYLGAVSATTYRDLYIYDRLSHVRLTTPWTAGATITTTGLGLPARAGAGHGVNAYLEVQASSVGGTPTLGSITVSYTNSDGVAGRTGTIGVYHTSNATYSSANPGIMWPLSLQSGDRGVRSVQSCTLTVSSAAELSASTLVLALHLSRPVFQNFMGDRSAGFQFGFYDLGPVTLGTDPCLFVAGTVAGATGAPQFGYVRLIQG